MSFAVTALPGIRILHRQGTSIRGIARELGISRETVRKYVREPGREPVYGPRAARPSKLEAIRCVKRYIAREDSVTFTVAHVKRRQIGRRYAAAISRHPANA